MAGGAGAGAVFAACGGGGPFSPPAPSAPVPTIGGDLDIARLAASVEVLATQLYASAIRAASSGALGKVPPAVIAFAAAAQQQHGDHARAWNSVLKKHGQNAQDDADPALATTVQPALGALATIRQLADLALSVEDAAVQTYVNSAAAIQDTEVRRVALTIAPVEAQHAAILHYFLGQFPIPDGIIPKDRARSIEDLHLRVETASPS